MGGRGLGRIVFWIFHLQRKGITHTRVEGAFYFFLDKKVTKKSRLTSCPLELYG